MKNTRKWDDPISGCFLYFLSKQAVLVAVIIKISHAPKLQPSFSVTLRVELYHLQPIGSNGCNKRNEVLFRHRMVNSDKMFVLHLFYSNCMIALGLFSL